MKRRCCGCKEYYPKDGCIKINAGYFHSYDCATQYAQDKSRKLREKKEDRDHRKRKRELRDNDRKFQLKKTQTIFNKYIRHRDKQDGCISCSSPFVDKFDAGHYRSTGAFPELRFNELNNNAQCVRCNQHLSGNLVDYRRRLIKKIGIKKVEWLEGPHEARRYTIDDLKQLQDMYKLKINGSDWREKI